MTDRDVLRTTPARFGVAETVITAPETSVSPGSFAKEQLILAILALQHDFVTRDQFFSAFDAWVADKSRMMADILVDQGFLDATRRDTLQLIAETLRNRQVADGESRGASVTPDRQIQLEEPGKRPQPEVLTRVDSLQTCLPEGGDSLPFEPFAQGDPQDKLGRFRVLRSHARGGLGIVSVALDQDLNREVALKQLVTQRADDADCRGRFLLEAEITGRLEHPGIVPVYALGEGPDGRPYYAMRFVQGDTLQEAIEDFHRADHPNRQLAGARQLALSQLLGRFIDVCNALDYAHSRGVLHRDVKPRNILVGKYGETLIVDWGLAKVLGSKEARRDESWLQPATAPGNTEHTQHGSVIGTLPYMSPEQAAGKLEELTPATDVFGLGATLYHILTGRPPYEKQDYAQLIAKVRRGEFKNPRDVNGEVPSALQGICLKAMSFKPADRYLSARELADDVERWLANEPLVAGIFHQLRQRLAVQFERTVLPSPADAAIEAGESRADLLLLSLVPTRRVRFVTGDRTYPADYELASLKAESLLARIYQARQVALDREVVVKVFKPRELDEETRRRHAPDELERVQATFLQRDRECFLSEAVVTANLEHPGIIPVHDIFRDDGGGLYIAMKWIRGMTWNNVLVDRTEAENVDTLLRAADVVAYAHSRGILHRDIKPANVFLGAFGETCVVDWGAALVTPDFRSWGTLSSFPTSGWGTPLYAAPEQILGSVEEIDVRSDVYLLGATLFEVLAGFPPHPVPADAAEVRGILQRNEIRPTGYRGPLLEIALRAMAANPADRYATVREFQAAIREAQSV